MRAPYSPTSQLPSSPTQRLFMAGGFTWLIKRGQGQEWQLSCCRPRQGMDGVADCLNMPVCLEQKTMDCHIKCFPSFLQIISHAHLAPVKSLTAFSLRFSLLVLQLQRSAFLLAVSQVGRALVCSSPGQACRIAGLVKGVGQHLAPCLSLTASVRPSPLCLITFEIVI